MVPVRECEDIEEWLQCTEEASPLLAGQPDQTRARPGNSDPLGRASPLPVSLAQVQVVFIGNMQSSSHPAAWRDPDRAEQSRDENRLKTPGSGLDCTAFCPANSSSPDQTRRDQT